MELLTESHMTGPEPILADLDGDGRPEILVTAEDGRLYYLHQVGGG